MAAILTWSSRLRQSGAPRVRQPVQINVANPTTSTASHAFIAVAAGSTRWAGRTMDRGKSVVPVTTLDALVARHGPAFIKIDIEGFEEEALAGLSRPIPALSFEFTTIQRDVALAALARCVALGYQRFNAALGESQTFVKRIGSTAKTSPVGWQLCRMRRIPGTSMPLSPDRRSQRPWRAFLAITALIVAGYVLTIVIFYPGIMTYDAKFVYEYIATGVARRLAVPCHDGAVESDRSGRTWCGEHVPPDGDLLLVGLRAPRHRAGADLNGAALLLLLLALTPPAFDFIGIIWRDMLFAISWLLAAAVAFAAAKGDARYRMPVRWRWRFARLVFCCDRTR